MKISNSYVIIYTNDNYTGASYTIPLREGLICKIHHQNILYNGVKSHFVAGPKGVWVRLHAEWPDMDEFKTLYGQWEAHGGRINPGDLPNLGLQNRVRAVSWHVSTTPSPNPHNCEEGWMYPGPHDVPPGYPGEWMTGTEDYPPPPLSPPPPIPADRLWCITLVYKSPVTGEFYDTEPLDAENEIDAQKKAKDYYDIAKLRDKLNYLKGYSLDKSKDGSCIGI